MLGLITLGLFAGYILAAYFIVKVQKSKRKKIIATTIMILIPTWDVIIGRTMLYTLCATQGGIHVYQTVELGPEYFDKEGMPLFYDRKKVFSKMSLAEKYVGVSEAKVNVSRLFNIKLSKDVILDSENNIILGEEKYYIHYGGWVFNFFNTGSGGGDGCWGLPSEQTIQLSKKIFLMK